MPTIDLLLDNRVHRTLLISTDTKPSPLTPASPYNVLLKVIGGIDNLVITNVSDTTIPTFPVGRTLTLPMTKSCTPQHCPSPVGRSDNKNCQHMMHVDDGLYRIVELYQNLIDPSAGTVMLVCGTTTDLPPQRTHKLLVSTPQLVTAMDDGGFKVPPDLAL
jgi:hypothetical protein